MEYAPTTLTKELERTGEGAWICMDPPTVSADGNWGSAYRLVYEVSSAMTYLHRNKLLHLDLKPDNILMCYSGTAVDVRWTPLNRSL